MKYPSQKNRLLFAWCCVTLMLVCLVAGIGNLTLRGEKALAAGLLEQACLVFEALFLFGFAGFFLYLSIMLFRGPPATAPTEVKRIDKMAVMLLSLGALFADAMALRLAAVLRSGNYETFYGELIACILVSLFGLLLTLGALIFIWKALLQKGPRLILPPSIPIVGSDFTGQIEVPMPANEAPEIVATLKMFRSVSDSVEFSSIAEVVWSQEVHITDFRPAGSCSVAAASVSPWTAPSRSISHSTVPSTGS